MAGHFTGNYIAARSTPTHHYHRRGADRCQRLSDIEALKTMSIVLYLNGTIYTMDAMQPRAQAMAIDTSSGRILAVGDNDEVRRVGGRNAEPDGLHGKTALPGFIGSHIHLLSTPYRSYYIDAEACTCVEEVA